MISQSLLHSHKEEDPCQQKVKASPKKSSEGAEVKLTLTENAMTATKKPDGTFEASRINVGRDGVVPQ